MAWRVKRPFLWFGIKELIEDKDVLDNWKPYLEKVEDMVQIPESVEDPKPETDFVPELKEKPKVNKKKGYFKKK